MQLCQQLDFSQTHLDLSCSFSSFSTEFSWFSKLIWSSRLVTYSFFLRLDKQADSRFLIIRWCRFNDFIWKKHNRKCYKRQQ